MKLHQLIGSTLVASDERADRLFFWNGDASIFLFQGGQFQASRPVRKPGSAAHALDEAINWRTHLSLVEQVLLALGRLKAGR